MRYSPKVYAESLNKVLESHPGKKEEMIKNFTRLLRKNGDVRLLSKILENLKRILVKKSGHRYVKIEFARELPESLVKKIIDKFNKKDWVETSLNPELVAGARITLDDEYELDNSLAKKLHKLFK